MSVYFKKIKHLDPNGSLLLDVFLLKDFQDNSWLAVQAHNLSMLLDHLQLSSNICNSDKTAINNVAIMHSLHPHIVNFYKAHTIFILFGESLGMRLISMKYWQLIYVPSTDVTRTLDSEPDSSTIKILGMCSEWQVVILCIHIKKGFCNHLQISMLMLWLNFLVQI